MSFFVARRGQVMQNLQHGDKLAVTVLERFESGKVMLDIKGTPVTARAEGDFPVGAKIDVVVQRSGKGFVLRRVGEDRNTLTNLAKFVRAKLGGMEKRSQTIAQVLAGPAFQSLGDAKTGLAGMYGKLVALLLPLLKADTGLAANLQNLGAVLGLSPMGSGDRLREFLGVNLPGLLDRMLQAGKKDFQGLLQRSGSLTPAEAENLTHLAGALKEQIGLFRGLNALLDARGRPLFISLPFLYQGEPQPTDIWVYKRHDAEGGRDDPDAMSAVVRLTMSRLGEVRAHVVLNGSRVSVRIFTETAQTAERLEESIPDLREALRGAGLSPAVSVREGLDMRPLPELRTMIRVDGEKRTLDVKA
ncbi:MAG: flagellar hook-length control protein FliK [Candidatus Lernaella stagnicola]|nr:flagellar hook-length control protein FliK [Candidatus Lernaella stagnicola]